MYKMSSSDKLDSDIEFPLENVNVEKLKDVFKLVEIDVSEIEGLTSSKRLLNFEIDKYYYKKPAVSPRFNNNNQNRMSGGKKNQKEKFSKQKVRRKENVCEKLKFTFRTRIGNIFEIKRRDFCKEGLTASD
ncbi:hypothetical protein Hanom_Chr13g01198791 [Helianthus anomalus]